MAKRSSGKSKRAARNAAARDSKGAKAGATQAAIAAQTPWAWFVAWVRRMLFDEVPAKKKRRSRSQRRLAAERRPALRPQPADAAVLKPKRPRVEPLEGRDGRRFTHSTLRDVVDLFMTDGSLVPPPEAAAWAGVVAFTPDELSIIREKALTRQRRLAHEAYEASGGPARNRARRARQARSDSGWGSGGGHRQTSGARGSFSGAFFDGHEDEDFDSQWEDDRRRRAAEEDERERRETRLREEDEEHDRREREEEQRRYEEEREREEDDRRREEEERRRDDDERRGGGFGWF